MRISTATSMLLFCLATSLAAMAQADTSPCWGRRCLGACRGGGGPGAWQDRRYDPKTVETLLGEIVLVETVPGARGGAGIHAVVKSDKETIPVHLGPAWYLEKQAVKLGQGDKVEVRGSRITFDGKPAVIAAEVKKNGQIVRLRDESGLPVWAGWRRGGR